MHRWMHSKLLRYKISGFFSSLLGILNSRLLSWWFVHKFGKMQRATFPQFKVNELADFPVPRNGDKHRDHIAKLAAGILAAKKRSPDANTTSMEREIDRLVYELFGLTKEERTMIEDWGVDRPAQQTLNAVAPRAAS
jgi:adenine-specific DNA-methyltransferase